MARPQNFSQEEFVRAALRIVDAEGLEALTFRRLGADMGVSYTTIYTYFENRDALITALMGQLLDEIESSIQFEGEDAHAKLMEVGLGIRRVMAQHPQWITTFMSTATGPAGAVGSGTLRVVSILEEAGVPKEDIATVYRVYEGYIMGATAFDFSAAPEHVSSRRRRYKGYGHSAFLAIAKTDQTVSAHNEDSFAFGLDRLLRGLGL